MKVKDLIAVLEGSDPEARVVVNLAFAGGITEITAAERRVASGFDGFKSFDRVPVVELSNGKASYMRSQGRDVEGDGVPHAATIQPHGPGERCPVHVLCPECAVIARDALMRHVGLEP